MSRLNQDALFLRRGRLGGGGHAPRPFLLLLIFISVGLLLLSRLNHSALAEARWRVASWLAPVLQTATIPVEPFREIGQTIANQLELSSELKRLRSENQKLSNWEWRARRLEAKLDDLESLSKVVAEQKLDFVTGRVISYSSGAFVRSVMIDAGQAQGVRLGFPVVNGDGLVGRIVDVGPSSARVLLASDLNSRIPVVVGQRGARAIAAGDNGAMPRLLYLPDGARPAVGDDVSTSGTGGLFPPGLRIGTVAGKTTEPRVALRASLGKLEYLSVLFFEDPAKSILGETSDPSGSSSASADASSIYPTLGRTR